MNNFCNKGEFHEGNMLNMICIDSQCSQRGQLLCCECLAEDHNRHEQMNVRKLVMLANRAKENFKKKKDDNEQNQNFENLQQVQDNEKKIVELQEQKQNIEMGIIQIEEYFQNFKSEITQIKDQLQQQISQLLQTQDSNIFESKEEKIKNIENMIQLIANDKNTESVNEALIKLVKISKFENNSMSIIDNNNQDIDIQQMKQNEQQYKILNQKIIDLQNIVEQKVSNLKNYFSLDLNQNQYQEEKITSNINLNSPYVNSNSDTKASENDYSSQKKFQKHIRTKRSERYSSSNKKNKQRQIVTYNNQQKLNYDEDYQNQQIIYQTQTTSSVLKFLVPNYMQKNDAKKLKNTINTQLKQQMIEDLQDEDQQNIYSESSQYSSPQEQGIKTRIYKENSSKYYNPNSISTKESISEQNSSEKETLFSNEKSLKQSNNRRKPNLDPLQSLLDEDDSSQKLDQQQNQQDINLTINNHSREVPSFNQNLKPYQQRIYNKQQKKLERQLQYQQRKQRESQQNISYLQQQNKENQLQYYNPYQNINKAQNNPYVKTKIDELQHYQQILQSMEGDGQLQNKYFQNQSNNNQKLNESFDDSVKSVSLSPLRDEQYLNNKQQSFIKKNQQQIFNNLQNNNQENIEKDQPYVLEDIDQDENSQNENDNNKEQNQEQEDEDEDNNEYEESEQENIQTQGILQDEQQEQNSDFQEENQDQQEQDEDIDIDEENIEEQEGEQEQEEEDQMKVLASFYPQQNDEEQNPE